LKESLRFDFETVFGYYPERALAAGWTIEVAYFLEYPTECNSRGWVNSGHRMATGSH